MTDTKIEVPVANADPIEEARITPTVPSYLHASDVLEFLRQLAVAVPDALTDACANDRPLWMAEEQFPVADIDAALVAHDVDEQSGWRLKDAMLRLKILQL
jgi:hypothetical protein